MNRAECWIIAFDKNDEIVYSSLLSQEEKVRASRYRLQADRSRFTVARGALRLILSVYLGKDPKDLEFEVDKGGKPRLKNSCIEFNLSHSGERVAIAMSPDVPLGVDVENLKKKIEWREIVQNFFHPDEIAEFKEVLDSERAEPFFRCWTRKEAVAKALGKGLSLPLDHYRVTFLPQDLPALIFLEGKFVRDEWSIVDLPLSDGYVGACAANDPLLQIICKSMDAHFLFSEFHKKGCQLLNN